MNSNLSSRNQSRNSRLISLNRSPCDCHEGDERYVVRSDRFQSETRTGLRADESPLPRREIPRTPTKVARSNCNSLVKSRSSRSLSRSRASNQQQHRNQDHNRNYYDYDDDGEDYEAYGYDAIFNSNRNNNANYYGHAHLDDDDLEAAETKLHVLAIKPRVAPRPRDNILFEGDMDLRTTFETTYEALARTRLEKFREYQLSLLQKQQHHDQVQQQHQMMSVQKSDETEQRYDAGSDALESKDREVSVAQTLLESQTSVGEDLEDPETARDAKLMSGHDHDARLNDQASPDQNQPTTSTTNNDQNIHDRNNINNKDDDSSVEQKFNDDVATKQNTSYIDPDLSPLIVYDSNMNRLVTVGLRKRSKYRPSTSLRSGAHGLFGDQNASSDSRPAVEFIQESKEIASRHETADKRQNARNLNNSRGIQKEGQGNHDDGLAAQTRRILNVNSKRKIRDNVNLQDHIRGDNLISHSPSPTWDYEQRQLQQHRHEAPDRVDIEEAALNEEVRRISVKDSMGNLRLITSDSSVNQSNEHTCSARLHNHNNHPIASRNVTPVNNANERSKLERICQNQSIDIFAAKYLDEESL